jgi:hypothetical protein
LSHAFIMLRVSSLTTIKPLTGLLTIISLVGVILTGYLRKRKSSGRRRRYHRYIAFSFLILLVVHTLI